MKKNNIVYIFVIIIMVAIYFIANNENVESYQDKVQINEHSYPEIQKRYVPIKEPYLAIIEESSKFLGSEDEVSNCNLSKVQLLEHSYPEVEKKYVPVKETIPFATIIEESSELYEGEEEVLVEGKDGAIETICLEEYINGKLIDKTYCIEYSIIRPENRVVKVGTKPNVTTSKGELDYTNSMVMSATAYDLSFESTGKNPGDNGYGITYSGTKAGPGTVAVDPNVIPLGTKLYIESLDGSEDYGFAVAEDTGGAIKGNKIDLFVEDSDEVKKFGIREVKVYILKE